MKKYLLALACLFCAMCAFAVGENGSAPASSSTSTTTTATAAVAQEHSSLRLEGEQRFRTNCGRCHQPPHKFPPRMMATIVRHMRVRAMLTDEDMKAILAYMTE